MTPILGSFKCDKYCNESYEGKAESGFMGDWIHTYKCEDSTLYEDVIGTCEDEDGFLSECTTYTCSKRD